MTRPAPPGQAGDDGESTIELPADVSHDIGRFFDAAGNLSRKGIISGPHYTLEISCYVCSKLYGIELIPYRQRADHDGILDNQRVIIRFMNCPHNRPLRIPDPGPAHKRSYDLLFAVLGPRCSLRPSEGNSLLIYRFQAEQVPEEMQRNGEIFEAGGGFFRNRTPDTEMHLG